MKRTHLSPEVLLEHRSWMERLALGLVADRQAAEDLVQEALVTALRQPPRGAADPPRLRAWLASVLRRASAQWRRSESRHRRRQEDSARPDELPPTDVLVAQAEMQRNVADAVVRLDEPYRTVVLLRYFEGLSSAEIARRMEQPSATVRSQLRRGLDQLRTELDEHYGGDRTVWCGLLITLLPEVAPAPLAPIGENSSIPILQGALVMKSTLQIALACVFLVLLAAAGLRTLGLFDSEPLAEREAPALVASSTDLQPPTHTGIAIPQSAQTSTRLEAGLPEPNEDRASMVGVESASAQVTCIARIVDEHGMGLVGAELSAEDQQVAAFSNAGGDVRLVLSVEKACTLELSAGLSGRATRWLHVHVQPGEETHLGEVMLAPAGSLSGFIEDAAGEPIAGARIVVCGLENGRRDPEELRRLGPTHNAHALSTSSGSDGQFNIEGAAAGQVRVWAGAQGYAWNGSGAVEVRGQRESADLYLVLAPLRSDDSIGGKVLTPEGEPARGVTVGYWFMGATYGAGGSLEVDDDGNFSHLLEQRVPYDLTVSDRQDRWADLHLPGVQPGTTNLVLQFVEPDWMDIVVVDQEGQPIEQFELGAYPLHDKYDSLEHSWTKERPKGRARMRRPLEAFYVRIEARGFRAWRSEDMPANSQIELIEATLEVLPGLSGRVLSDGRPVAGAQVWLHEALDPRIRALKNDFRCQLRAYVTDKDQTDADGRFKLFPPKDGGYHIIAEAPGLALAGTGRLELEIAVAHAELELELGIGGAIEGRVLLGDGLDPSGIVLGFNRGDGRARTLRVGEEGFYHIGGLTAGDWVVDRRDREIDPSNPSNSFAVLSSVEPMEFNCEVFDGQTTHFDLDLRGQAACQVAGRLNAGAVDLSRWSVSLAKPGLGFGEEVFASALLSKEGAFELEVDVPGEYLLLLQAPPSNSGRLLLTETLQLVPGLRAWQYEIALGSIEGSGASISSGAEEVLEYSWRPIAKDRDLKLKQRIVVDEQGRFTLPFVPAGAGRISKYRTPEPGEAWGQWIELMSFEVEAGRQLQLLLPQ